MNPNQITELSKNHRLSLLQRVSYTRFVTPIRTLFLVFSSMTSLIAVACADSAPESDGAAPATDTEIEVVSESPNEDSSYPADARSGGVLVFPAPSCGIPDPAIDPVLLDGPMVGEIHAGLTRIGKDRDNRSELELAERYAVREQGTVYEFTLRPDLRFSDGSPVSASDFKWSWERAISLAVSGSNAEHVFEPVKGYDDVRNGDTLDLSGVEVIDDRTLRVTLRHPTPHLPMLVAHHVASVLKQGNVNDWNLSWTNSGTFAAGEEPFWRSGLPVGAGPFRVSKYDPRSEKCQLKRNEHYWSRNAHIEGVIFNTNVYGTSVDGLGQGDNLFVAGEIDYHDLWDTNPNDLGITAVQIDTIRQLNAEYLLFNPTIPPFDNIHFRRSLMSASPQYISSTNPYSVEQRFFTMRVPLDPGVASEEAQKCECPDNHNIRLSYYSTFVASAGLLVETVFDQWNRLLDVEVATHHESRHQIQEMASSGTLEMLTFYHTPAYPDPSAQIQPILSKIPGGDTSEIVAKLQRLAKSAASEQDQAKRSELWHLLEQRVLEAALVLPIALVGSGEGHVQPWVNGLVFPEYGGSMFYDVWLDGAPERVLD